MKKATARANKTVHAPNRKGGPGMTSFYRWRENRCFINKRKKNKNNEQTVMLTSYTPVRLLWVFLLPAPCHSAPRGTGRR